MRSTTLVILFLGTFLGCRQSALKEIRLNGVWRSNTSDSLSFSNFAYQDNHWDTANTISEDSEGKPASLSKWFRYKIFIPERSEWPIDTKMLQFFFSVVDADDDFFLNGRYVGSNGINNDTVTVRGGVSQYVARIYEMDVTDSSILWGADNVIAIRISGKSNPELLTKNAVLKSSEFAPHIRHKFKMDWKVAATDSMVYSISSLDKQPVLNIQPGKFWELQGLPDYDGYTWYWKTFLLDDALLPSNSRLRLSLGKIDDNDQVFFDGLLIGENGKNVPKGNSATSNQFAIQPTQADLTREYDVDLTNKKINKGLKHSIAVRVFDSGGDGGMLSEPYYSLLGESDNIRVDLSKFYRINDKNVLDTVAVIYNDSPKYTFEGSLSCLVQKTNFDKIKAIKNEIKIKPMDSVLVPISIAFSTEKLNLYFTIDHKAGSNIFYDMVRLPFILVK
jgi:hypothetical protein